MNILTVTNPEAFKLIHVYTAKCSQNLRNDVLAALIELDLRVEPGIDVDIVIDEITRELERGNNFWFNEIYCFEVISV